MNMTGDPNQQNTSGSFLGVNFTYASANPVDWAKFSVPSASSSGAMDAPRFPMNFASPTQPVNVPPPDVRQAITLPQQTVPELVSFSPPNVPLMQAPSFHPQTLPGETASFSAPTAPLSNYSFGAAADRSAPVQFPFPATLSTPAGGEFGSNSLHIPLRCKRKTDSPPPPPTKQHITDEKMAEHMAQLHINSETVTSAMQPEPGPARERRLYMCEEMRKLQQDSILPQALLNRINRPCTAVVLWTPPPRVHVPTLSENNNEEDEPDNNVMDLDSMN